MKVTIGNNYSETQIIPSLEISTWTIVVFNNYGLVWFLCLMALFNAKAIHPRRTRNWEDKGVHTFPKGICPKVNVIVRLEYELAYYDSIVHRFNHYTTRTPP